MCVNKNYKGNDQQNRNRSLFWHIRASSIRQSNVVLILRERPAHIQQQFDIGTKKKVGMNTPGKMKILAQFFLLTLFTSSNCFLNGNHAGFLSSHSQISRNAGICLERKEVRLRDLSITTLNSCTDSMGSSKSTRVKGSWNRRDCSYFAFASAASILFPKAGTANSINAESESLFYSRWQYARPADILPFIYSTSTKGDIDGILAAMDEVSCNDSVHTKIAHCFSQFGKHYPMYKLGEEKGRILEEELSNLPSRPKVISLQASEVNEIIYPHRPPLPAADPPRRPLSCVLIRTNLNASAFQARAARIRPRRWEPPALALPPGSTRQLHAESESGCGRLVGRGGVRRGEGRTASGLAAGVRGAGHLPRLLRRPHRPLARPPGPPPPPPPPPPIPPHPHPVPSSCCDAPASGTVGAA